MKQRRILTLIINLVVIHCLILTGSVSGDEFNVSDICEAELLSPALRIDMSGIQDVFKLSSVVESERIVPENKVEFCSEKRSLNDLLLSAIFNPFSQKILSGINAAFSRVPRVIRIVFMFTPLSWLFLFVGRAMAFDINAQVSGGQVDKLIFKFNAWGHSQPQENETLSGAGEIIGRAQGLSGEKLNNFIYADFVPRMLEQLKTLGITDARDIPVGLEMNIPESYLKHISPSALSDTLVKLESSGWTPVDVTLSGNDVVNVVGEPVYGPEEDGVGNLPGVNIDQPGPEIINDVQMPKFLPESQMPDSLNPELPDLSDNGFEIMQYLYSMDFILIATAGALAVLGYLFSRWRSKQGRDAGKNIFFRPLNLTVLMISPLVKTFRGIESFARKTRILFEDILYEKKYSGIGRGIEYARNKLYTENGEYTPDFYLPYGYGRVDLREEASEIEIVSQPSAGSGRFVLSLDPENKKIVINRELFMSMNPRERALSLIAPLVEIIIKDKFTKMGVELFSALDINIREISALKEVQFGGGTLFDGNSRRENVLRKACRRVFGKSLSAYITDYLRDLMEDMYGLFKRLKAEIKMHGVVKGGWYAFINFFREGVIRYGRKPGIWFCLTELFCHFILPPCYCLLNGGGMGIFISLQAPAEMFHKILLFSYFVPIVNYPIHAIIDFLLDAYFSIKHVFQKKIVRQAGIPVGMADSIRNEKGFLIPTLANIAVVVQEKFESVQVYLNNHVIRRREEIYREVRRQRLGLLVHRAKAIDDLHDTPEEWETIKTLFKDQQEKLLIIHYNEQGIVKDNMDYVWHDVIPYCRKLNRCGIVPVIENPLSLISKEDVIQQINNYNRMVKELRGKGVRFKIAINISKAFQGQHGFSLEESLGYISSLFKLAEDNELGVIVQMVDNRTDIFSDMKNSVPLGEGSIPYDPDVLRVISRFQVRIEMIVLEFSQYDDLVTSRKVLQSWLKNIDEYTLPIEADAPLSDQDNERPAVDPADIFEKTELSPVDAGEALPDMCPIEMSV